MVLNADMAICDSKNIEKYILETYPTMKNKTTYIAYGADVSKSNCTEESLEKWYTKYDLKKNNYYLIVGRFVPENNYETIISEFMKSDTEKSLVIISNVEKNKFYAQLKETTNFESDGRIKFVGTVYDRELLKKIREEAFAYIHGHEVGGTNPSLLEALASTKLNLLLDVGFNREVAEDTALYWDKKEHYLSGLINIDEDLSEEYIMDFDVKSTKQVEKKFNWNIICEEYERKFL